MNPCMIQTDDSVCLIWTQSAFFSSASNSSRALFLRQPVIGHPWTDLVHVCVNASVLLSVPAGHWFARIVIFVFTAAKSLLNKKTDGVKVSVLPLCLRTTFIFSHSDFSTLAIVWLSFFKHVKPPLIFKYYGGVDEIDRNRGLGFLS